MAGRNDLLVDVDPGACGRGRIVLVGTEIMDPVIVIAALIIIAAEMWIRLL